MIAFIEGKLISLDSDTALVQVGPIGYEVMLPGYAVSNLAGRVGKDITLCTMEYYEGTMGGGNLIPRMVGFLTSADRDFFAKFTTVKGMGIERPMRLKWEKKYAHALDVDYRAQRFNILVGLVSQLLNATVTITILWMGANLVLAQQLTIGQLIAFNALMGSVMSPLMGLVAL